MSTIQEETAQKIAVMQAFLDGEAIEVRSTLSVNDKWYRVAVPVWNFSQFEYRIKAKPREFYLNIYPYGTICVHATVEKANSNAGSNRQECILVREVLSEE